MCEGNIIHLPYNARTSLHQHDTECIDIETEDGKSKMEITHSADTMEFSMYPNRIHLKPGHTLTLGLRITYTRILSISFSTMNSSFKWSCNAESYEVQIYSKVWFVRNRLSNFFLAHNSMCVAYSVPKVAASMDIIKKIYPGWNYCLFHNHKRK